MMNRQQRRAEARQGPTAVPDPAPEPIQEQHQQMTVTIASTQRHVVISFPVDMTEAELLEFVGWETTQLRQHLAEIRAKTAGGRIILPAGVLPT